MANPSPFELFETFYLDGLPPGRLPLYTTTLRGGNQRTYWCYNLRQIDRHCSTFRNTRRVTFGLALHDTQAALAIAKERRGKAVLGTIRGSDASVTTLPALWVEIPYGAPPLPPDLRHALGLLEAVCHRPSIAISDGGSLSAFWLLKHVWRFDLENTAAEKATARDLLRRLRWAVVALAAERGWRLELERAANAGLTAAFPLPDSPVGASAKGPRGVLETFPLVSGCDRYHPRDFEALPQPPARQDRPWQDVLEPSPNLRPRLQIFPLEPIVRGCAWLRHCHSDRATLDRLELDHATRLLLRCEAPGADRVGLVHELHAGHPAYDPATVDSSIAAALRAPENPVTCRRIGTAPGVVERYCASCASLGTIRGPLDLARQGDAADGATAMERATEEEGLAGEETTPGILVTRPQHEVNDRALAALAAAGVLHEHAGRLVEVDAAADTPPGGGPPGVRPVRAARLQELLSRHCTFVTESGGERVPARPPRWTTRALLARGSWPEIPRLDEPPSLPVEAAADQEPVEAADLEPGSEGEGAELLAGLETLLESHGGAATARRIVAVLAAEPERYPELATTLPRLIPDLDPAEPGAAAALGFCLRRFKGRALGGRILDETRRTRYGVEWAVRYAPRLPPPELRKEEASP